MSCTTVAVCAYRECRPRRSGGVVVLVEDAAEPLASADVELTDLGWLGAQPCRTASRPASCLPFGPANPVISASIIAAITFRPVATLIANSPSRAEMAASDNARRTSRAGRAAQAWRSSRPRAGSVPWSWRSPSMGRLGGRPTPTPRQASGGDRHLKSNKIRDNVWSRRHHA
jgi:hypothetical protein